MNGMGVQECNIFAYPDHNYLTASVPVPRLHVYVRRLVQAGHQVSVICVGLVSCVIAIVGQSSRDLASITLGCAKH